MKILGLSLAILNTLFISLGVKGHEIDDGVKYYLNSLSSVIDYKPDTSINLAYAAVANMNDTIKNYEAIYNKSTDECLRGCYAYSIHMLEIYNNLNCDSKFSKINDEYKKNKPCYKANQDMQNILDHGNAYLDLFCAKKEDNKEYCPFVSEISKIQTNTTLLEESCGSNEKNRTKCDNTLINNLSIMIDAEKKLKDSKAKNPVTYASGGETISISTPQYNLTDIEASMKNSTCVKKIEAPKQILVNINSTNTRKNDTKADGKESSEAVLGQHMNALLALITVALTALLF